MLYRAPLLAIALLAVSSCGPRSAPDQPTASRRRIQPPRRVVLVLIDTLRRDHLPTYGYDKQTAPFLDRLAREGVVFEHAVSTSSWTAPATASLFTGLYPFQHGVVTGFLANQRIQRGQAILELNSIPAAAETIAELFAGAGYETFAVAENVNLDEKMGFAQGFQHYAHLPGKESAGAIHKRLRAWREGILAAPRSFLYLHYYDPHRPYVKRAPMFDRATTGVAREVSAYDSEIRHVDNYLAQAAAELGWDEDTLVVVTADHGEAFGEHGDWRHSETLYGELTNVPMIMRLPSRRAAGRRVADRVSLVDLLPTFRDLLGLPLAPDLPGQSLLPVLQGKALPPRQLYAHLLRHDDDGRVKKHLRAVWADNWKWIGGDPGGPQLFDLSADPRELENMASRRPEITRALEQRYDAFARTATRMTGEKQAFVLPPAKQEELRALGYVR